MQLFVSDQWQPIPYLAPFSHNTSVTDGQTEDNHANSSTFTKVR